MIAETGIGKIETTKDPDVRAGLNRRRSPRRTPHNGMFDSAHHHGDAGRGEWIIRLGHKSHRPGAKTFR